MHCSSDTTIAGSGSNGTSAACAANDCGRGRGSETYCLRRLKIWERLICRPHHKAAYFFTGAHTLPRRLLSPCHLRPVQRHEGGSVTQSFGLQSSTQQTHTAVFLSPCRGLGFRLHSYRGERVVSHS